MVHRRGVSTWNSAALSRGLLCMIITAGGVAAGMTIKFFGLFFYERCGLSPVAVSSLATVAPFLVSGGVLCRAMAVQMVTPFAACITHHALPFVAVATQNMAGIVRCVLGCAVPYVQF